MEYTIIQKISILALPLIFAITLHEVAHGYVASLFGDQTARFSGRLSMNPIKHIDLIGTILVPMVMINLGNFIFGWAKPVPVDARNLRHPRRDMAFVALAGPAANLLMAMFWALMAKIGLVLQQSGNPWFAGLIYMGEAGIYINVGLAVLNLIPLPPLDGGRILASVLPPRWAYHLSMIEPYSFFILILILVTGAFSRFLQPLIFLLVDVISYLFGFV